MAVNPSAVASERTSGLQPGFPDVGQALEDQKQTKEVQGLVNQYFGQSMVRVDGAASKPTRNAIAMFQRAERLTGVTPGVADATTLDALRRAAPLGYGHAQQVSVDAERQRAGRDAVATPTTPAASPLALPQPNDKGIYGKPYTVRSGDTVDSIAYDHRITRAQLLALNPLLADPTQKNGVAKIDTRTPIFVPAKATTRVSEKMPVLPSTDPSPHTNPGAWTGPEDKGRLQRNALTLPAVRGVQERLQALGFDTGGKPDGRFKSGTQEAVRLFQAANNLPQTGIVDDGTWKALESGESKAAPASAQNLKVYPPGSPQQVQLFRDAIGELNKIRAAKSPPQRPIPLAWASSPALQRILTRESNGVVGKPNYTIKGSNDPSKWPDIWKRIQSGEKIAKSSATGLGQLLGSNVDKYYPNGRAGIGDPLQEAAGMLAYIADRYGSPEVAWARYGKRHEGY